MQVTYNGVTLPYSTNSHYRMKSVFDDLSDTDRVLTQFDIEVRAVVNINYIALLMPDLVLKTGNAGSVMKVLGERLRAHRKTLSVKVAGVEMIPERQPGLAGTVDAKNGPKVMDVDIISFTNETFEVTFHVVAHYWDKFDVASTSALGVETKRAADVLYNRWSEEVTIDEAGYSRRVRSGKFVIRSDNASGVTPDQLRRQMAVVSVPAGFVRESAKYVQSPDGLALSYTITDREVFAMPAPGAMKSSGWYRESCGMFAVKRYAEAYVKLIGDKSTDQQALVNTAIVIVMRKLRSVQASTNAAGGARVAVNGPNLFGRAINRVANAAFLPNIAPNHVTIRTTPVVRAANVVAAHVKADFYENVAECYVKVWYGNNKRRVEGINGFQNSVAGTPLSDGFAGQPAYFDRGTAGLLLQAASYYDPSVLNVQLAGGADAADSLPSATGADAVQLNRGLQPGQAGKEGE